jgi:hypothetical protein
MSFVFSTNTAAVRSASRLQANCAGLSPRIGLAWSSRVQLLDHSTTSPSRSTTPVSHCQQRRPFSSSTRMDAKYAPAKRVAGQKQDVWSIVNEAAAASPVQPIVNMGQGFL